MTKHTVTISELDDFQAEHIFHILNEYKIKCLGRKLEAMV